MPSETYIWIKFVNIMSTITNFLMARSTYFCIQKHILIAITITQNVFMDEQHIYHCWWLWSWYSLGRWITRYNPWNQQTNEWTRNEHQECQPRMCKPMARWIFLLENKKRLALHCHAWIHPFEGMWTSSGIQLHRILVAWTMTWPTHRKQLKHEINSLRKQLKHEIYFLCIHLHQQ